MSVAGCETACPGVMPAAVGYSQELYCWGRILGPGSAALLFPAPPTATPSAIPCPRCGDSGNVDDKESSVPSLSPAPALGGPSADSLHGHKTGSPGEGGAPHAPAAPATGKSWLEGLQSPRASLLCRPGAGAGVSLKTECPLKEL